MKGFMPFIFQPTPKFFIVKVFLGHPDGLYAKLNYWVANDNLSGPIRSSLIYL